MKFKTRIAPTPSGYLHIGNASNFVLTWLHARTRGGTVLLRIDDLDQARVKPEYVEDIFRTLDWLGLDWEEGPFGPGDLEKTWSQRHRIPRYQEGLEALAEQGVAYACALSRAQIAEAGGYPDAGFSQNLPLDQPDLAWRARTEDREIIFADIDGRSYAINLQEEMKAFVLRRRDGLPAYQLASLQDDVDMEVNLIIRGEDLLASTAAQRWLAEILGYESFLKARFVHHGLLTDETGQKLSKSAGANAVAEWRARRQPAAQFLKEVARWLGLPPVGSLDELRGAFLTDGGGS